MRLNHFTLPATDVEASAEFYRRLGLRQIVESYPSYARFMSPEGEATLSLMQGEPGGGERASVHFEVEDVDAAVRELEAKGFEFESQPTDQPYLWREAVLLDPDGNPIFVFRAGENRLDPPWKLPAG